MMTMPEENGQIDNQRVRSIAPQHFVINHQLQRRVRITVKSLRNDRERAYILEILLYKRDGVKRTRLVPAIGSLIIDFDPSKIPKDTLFTVLDAIIPNLGKQQASANQNKESRLSGAQCEVNFAIEGMTCASCACLVELILKRDPRIGQASVNFASETATVQGGLSKQAVYEIVERVGYRALPLDTLSQRKVLVEREEKRLGMARRRLTWAAIFTVPLMAIGMSHAQGRIWHWLQLLLSTPVVTWAGRPFFEKAYKLAKQRSANMDSLVAMGVGSAYLYSIVALFKRSHAIYFEAAGSIITFVLLGRYLEERAKGKAHEAIYRLINLQPEVAHVIRSGKEVTVSVDDLVVGDLMIIRPGDKIPTDGVIQAGITSMDESMVTGESLPIIKEPGNQVVGGCINGNGSLRVQVTAVGGNTVLASIIHMVDQAQSSKLPIQKTVDRVSSIFVPSVMAIAVITFIGARMAGLGFASAFSRAVSVLLIACPCALGLATPAAVMVGTGQAARRGVYIRNGESLQAVTKLTTIVFDKTGTITQGKARVTDFINLSQQDKSYVLALAAAAETGSEHFLAKAIVAHAQECGIEALSAEQFMATPGLGIRTTVDQHQLFIGNQSWLEQADVNLDAAMEYAEQLATQGKTPVYLSIDGHIAGLFGIADQPRSNAKQAIERLHKLGVKTLMVTGDTAQTARYIAQQVGIDDVIAHARPERKLEIVRELQSQGAYVGMIGDGINDAPALAAADVSFAIGTGTDIAIQTADLILIKGDINKVADMMELSGATLRIIHQNLFWAFGYNIIAIPIAAYGKLNPMIASVTMALSSVSVVANSLRLQKK